MVPCKDCVVYAICQSIITEGIERLNIVEGVAAFVDRHYKYKNPGMKFKSFLTQESIDILVNQLVDRCSIMSDYIVENEIINQEHYWNARQFYKLTQGEYNNDDITVV